MNTQAILDRLSRLERLVEKLSQSLERNRYEARIQDSSLKSIKKELIEIRKSVKDTESVTIEDSVEDRGECKCSGDINRMFSVNGHTDYCDRWWDEEKLKHSSADHTAAVAGKAHG